MGKPSDGVPLRRAKDAAYATDTYRQMNEAVPDFYGTYIDNFGGEQRLLSAPMRSGDGWTVTLTSRLLG